MSKTFITIPAGDGWVHARLVQSLNQMQDKDTILGIFAGISPVARARNTIVEQFLQTDCSHLLMIDADTVPEPTALKKLLTTERDVVSGVTPIIRQGAISSNIYLDTSGVPLSMEEVAAKNGPFTVEGVGAACLLIKREVLEKVGRPWFAEVWGEGGECLSEDLFFCNRAKEEGYKISIAPEVVCKHVRDVVI
jgi:GT2 family glycosyltransferase